ncbi:MAG TPA: peptide chain release factor N(5)-glutamine methyltransferase [Microbacteriaceae bacterium]
MNLSQLIASISEELASSGIESPAADARELICYHQSISKSELSMMEIQGHELNLIDESEILALVSKRAMRIPLQHITGKSYFRNLELEVGPGVFTPRPETETLVEIALGLDLPERTSFEVGAGSGAISISLTEESDFQSTALEVSEQAAVWTKKNIAKYGDRVRFVLDDFETFVPDQKYGLLISNPPYIPETAIPVDPEVRLYDPEQALYSGADGLDVIRMLADSKNYLLPGGVLLFEHDESQRQAIVELLLEKEWNDIRWFPDLNGRDRFIQAVA